MSDTYTISALAKEFNITTRAIRFYEDHGLINPTRSGRNRIYSKRDRTRLQLTLRGKRLGFSLNEIRELFELYDSSKGEKTQLERLLQTLTKHRNILEQRQQEIDAVLSEITVVEEHCKLCLAQYTRKRDTASE